MQTITLPTVKDAAKGVKTPPLSKSDTPQKKKFTYYDSYRISDDANNPQTFFNLLPHIDFKQVGATFRGKGKLDDISISRTSNGTWILKDHAGKHGIPNGDVFNVVKRLHNLNPKDKGDLNKICRILTAASGGQLHALTNDENTAYKTKYVAPPKVEFIPNKGQALKISSVPVYADFDSPIGSEVLKYFSRFGITRETLTRYNIRPVSRINHETYNGYLAFNPNDFAYSWTVGDVDQTAKYKRPNAPQKGDKERFLQNSGNYVFGWQQLPADLTDITLVIAAGEKDTLAVNQYLNASKIYAVCFNSETTRFDFDFIANLKGRCKGIYTLFDNDKTGEQAMRAAAIEHGLPAIKLNDYFPALDKTFNDVCDVVEKHPDGSDFLQKIVFEQIRTKTAVAKIPNDVFSIGVYDALKIDVERYVSEGTQQIKEYIKRYQKLLLQAPPGTGKSWQVIDLAETLDSNTEDNFLRSVGIHRIIHVVPTGITAQQFQKDYNAKTGKYAPIIDGSFSDYESIEKENYKLLICTYDSLPKVTGLIDTALFSGDEIHLLRDADGYRDRAVSAVFDFVTLAKRCLFISATPLLELTTGITEDFNFKLCKVVAKQQQTVKIQPRLYTTGTHSDLFRNWYDLTAAADGKKMLQINDVSKLDTFAELTNAAKNKDVSTIISSAEKKYSDDNPNYQSLVNAGTVAKDFIFSTCLLETAVSVRQKVASVGMLGATSINSIYQFNTRARMLKDGTNNTVQGYNYHSVTAKEARRITAQFNDPSEQPQIRTKDTLSKLKETFKQAEDNAAEANKYSSQVTETQSKYFDSFSDIRYSILAGKYVPNIANILHAEQRRIEQLTGLYEMYRRLQQMYPNVEVQAPQVINPKKDKEVRDAITDKKEKKKELTRRGFELLRADQRTVFEIQLNKTKSKTTRKAIMTHLGFTVAPKEMTPTAQQIYSENTELFDSDLLGTPVERFLKISLLRNSKLTDTAILNLIEYGTTNDYKVFYNSLITAKELKADNANLSGKAIARKQTAEKVRKEIKRLKELARKKERPLLLTKKQLLGIAVDVTGLKFTDHKKPLMWVSELFEVQSTRVAFTVKDDDGNDRRIQYRAYEIGNSHSKTSLIQSLQKYSVIRSEGHPPNSGKKKEVKPLIIS